MSATPDTPPGWSYNPASWGQRLPLVGLAAVGFVIAGYLSLYQFGVIPSVWEPLFEDGRPPTAPPSTPSRCSMTRSAAS